MFGRQTWMAAIVLLCRTWQYLALYMKCIIPLSLSIRQKFVVHVLLLAGTLCSGCATPRYTIGLADVLRQELGASKKEITDYRCTMGAHRGDSLKYEENTLEAIISARHNRKYAFVEFDVQYSKDHQIVVFHDKRLFRVFGKLQSIDDSTYEELHDLTDGQIASYDEVMRAVTGKRINIEIKSQGDLQEDRRLVDHIVADLKARGMYSRALISSISGDVIKYTSLTYPEIPTGRIFWIRSSTYLPFESLTRKLYRGMEVTGADYLMLHAANLHDIEDLIELKPKGRTIVFWDFDDTMYLVHKDYSDRLWGQSRIRTFLANLRYGLYSLFHRTRPSD